jgi:predicted nucleotidyltransferase
MTTLLVGTVGSTAYGLAHAGSDIDRLGVYAEPTLDVCVHPKKADGSQVRRNPDVTLHEVGKYVRLAAAANPTVLELLWLDRYETSTPMGELLVAHRHVFLSDLVVNTYGGYARQQVHRLRQRGDGSFGADLRKRKAKHARHCFRLLVQGAEVRRTGKLVVRLTPGQIDQVRSAEALVDDEDKLIAAFDEAYAELVAVKSVLPALPDQTAIDGVLRDVRVYYWHAPCRY